MPRAVKAVLLALLIFGLFPLSTAAQVAQPSLEGNGSEEFTLSAEVCAPDGRRLPGVSVRGFGQNAATDTTGRFTLLLPAGTYRLEFSKSGYASLILPVSLRADTDLNVTLQPSSAITVSPEPDVLSPDPSTRVMAGEDLLDANPGRPGAPVSVPGLPTETASGGIKAPQYFAPGVAGDHGEPIALFFSVGDFLFPNNLTANAHGNGYADPNLLIPAVVGSVETDAGAFNTRYGDHAINLAVNYALRPRLDSFIETTGDSRDADVVVGWSPSNPATHGWLASEAAAGNGFLKRPESRQQYKINGYQGITRGNHNLSIFGLGYYGFSRIPGLIPIAVPFPGDTIDARQSDLTHTALAVVSDTWNRTDRQQFQFSGFFRTYSLRLLSNFGDGLIRQSEFRTVAGGNTSFVFKPRRDFSLLAGADARRDAPHDLNLDRANPTGVFHRVSSNNLTISSFSPFSAISGKITPYLQYHLGVRRDQFLFDNSDLLAPAKSYGLQPGITSPKATFTIAPPSRFHLPVVALSYGQAFHVNDPRIGAGKNAGTPIAKSRAYQLVATEFVARTQLSLTLAQSTNSAQLAKIDPDTGLQENVGPSRIRSLTFSARRYLPFGFIQVYFSRADAGDALTGEPVPEAPRLIWDALGTINRLPFRVHAKGEFEYVGRKPLGDGFNALPVREIRGCIARSFEDGRWDAGLNFLAAQGYSGQTLETLQLPTEPAPFERIVGVRLASYASVSLTYHLSARPSPPK